MTLSPDKLDQIHGLIQKEFPGWTGSQDERFIHNETGYKRDAARLAGELLSEAEFNRLMDAREYDELIRRLRKVAQKTNLLFLGIPRKGDLGILTMDNLGESGYFEVLFDLLYGPGDSHERLERYAAYITAHNLPNRWTFPTYYLYLLYPETEVYVRPRNTIWLVELLGLPAFPHKPEGGFYAELKKAYGEIRDGLKSFGLVDMIDVQSALWAAYDASQAKNRLGSPFDKLFKDLDQANWAFDVFQEAFSRLEITNPDNPMLAVTMMYSGNKVRMHLTYGNWLILGFGGANGALIHLEIALLKQTLELNPEYEGDFQVKPGEPNITYYRYPIATVLPFETKIQPAFVESLEKVRAHFGGWTKSPSHRHHLVQLARAILDPSVRSSLLSEGMPIEETAIDDSSGDVTARPVPAAFTPLVFELLEGIHTNPTLQYYQEHKEAFQEHVIQPFQNLMRRVAARLPQPILERMETEKSIFSRFNKNDYGQGGCWDHYWGAFYPKGSKRTESAQLSLWMNFERLSIVFYIGEYGTRPREQFRKNTRQYAASLPGILQDLVLNPDYLLARNNVYDLQSDQTLTPQFSVSWDDWFQAPESTGFGVRIVLSPEQVLRTPAQELEDRIVQAFSDYFPLVLLTMEADPIPAIQRYLGVEDVDVEDLENVSSMIQPEYPLEQVSVDTGFERETVERWARAIERKGQAIFYGPPGTGKTHIAHALARHLIGGGDGFTDLVQFHPAYSYEDFMQGIRPQRVDGGLDYPTLPGRFLDFCRKAQACSGRCVLIVDEINRANLARVFGELMYLLEYRGESIPLASGGSFHIPGNVRLLGTMNTADRSIALVDHALRRRFAFLALYPNYSVLQRFHQSRQTGFPVDELVAVMRRLNEDYIQDPHYQVGISYFLRADLLAQIADIWEMEIFPYLEEYFFDQPAAAREFRWEKVAALLGL